MVVEALAGERVCRSTRGGISAAVQTIEHRLAARATVVVPKKNILMPRYMQIVKGKRFYNGVSDVYL